MPPSPKIIWPPSSRYVAAVSGGVDSMVLLDLLQTAAADRGYQLVVAHLDHGMRPDSSDDARFVADMAAASDLKFWGQSASLGENASEDQARRVRYEFLEKVRSAESATAIITGHHLDDLLETAVFNLIRGTNRTGLTSLSSRPGLLRPLLGTTKVQLKQYALSRGLQWREDATNKDQAKSRNYIRHTLLPRARKLGVADSLQALVAETGTLNDHINRLLEELLESCASRQDSRVIFDRQSFAAMPELVARHLIHHALKSLKPDLQADKQQLASLVDFLKSPRTGKKFVLSDLEVTVGYDQINFQPLGYKVPPNVPTAEGLPAQWRARTWHPGDKVQLRFGQKKLQDVFVDAKIDRAARQSWPVVVDAEDRVIWVPQLTPRPTPKGN